MLFKPHNYTIYSDEGVRHFRLRNSADLSEEWGFLKELGAMLFPCAVEKAYLSCLHRRKTINALEAHQLANIQRKEAVLCQDLHHCSFPA